MRVLREPWVAKGGEPGETVDEFARRRLGPQVAERLIDPFVTGIFAGDPARLSVAAAFPRLVELENQFGSLITASRKLKKERGKDANAAGPSGRLTSFPGGMREMVMALGTALGPSVRLNARVDDVRRVGERWAVSAADGAAITDVDDVIMAIPAYVAARILSKVDASLAEPLTAIPYAPAAVVCLGFEKDAVQHDLNGFGFLIPKQEQRQILGCLWTSSIFPGQRAPEGHALIRTIVGGSRAPDLALLPEEELYTLVQDELDPVLGLDGAPVFWHLQRWPSAIPQYEVGHIDRRNALADGLSRWPGLHLTGNALYGVGINDCTREAERVARLVLGVADAAPEVAEPEAAPEPA